MFGLQLTILRVACLIALTFVAACSSSGRTSVLTENPDPIRRGATASLSVVSVAEKPLRKQFEVEQSLRENISERLVNSGIFRRVSINPDEAADYRINIRIDGMRIRSGAARVIFGIFAGRSYVRVHVDLLQTNPHRLLRSFETTGYGGKTAVSARSYGYDDPVREIVAQVIKNIQ